LPAAESPPIAPSSATRSFTIVAAIIAAIALVITLSRVGLATVADELRAIGGWFAVLVALEAVSALCDALTIHGFLGPGPARSSFARVLHAQVSGRAINLVTPLASLGEATKAALLMRDTASARAIGAVARFNASYVAINLGFVVLGAPICAAALSLPTWLERTLWLGSVLALAIGTGAAWLIRAGASTSVLGALRRIGVVSTARQARWHDKLADIDRTLRGERGWRDWWPGLWALGSKLIQWLTAWIVMAANGHAPTLGVMAAIATAGTLINIVANLVPLGLGVTEGGGAALMAALGQPPSLGVTMAIARRAIQLVYAAFGLLLVLSAHARPWRRSSPP
jgi:uncharacterized membrane protein YbhN (UPF0104 family)